MLTIHVPGQELFNEATNEFITLHETDLRLEHSLISLSKWESKWKKPFLSEENESQEELIDYIKCMCVDHTFDEKVIEHLSRDKILEIKDYIGDKQTATQIYDRRPGNPAKKEVITSEVIYYHMIYFGIPFECQKWHLNRLLTLIRVCSIKGGTTNQEMSLNAIFAQNNALHKARRAGK